MVRRAECADRYRPTVKEQRKSARQIFAQAVRVVLKLMCHPAALLRGAMKPDELTGVANFLNHIAAPEAGTTLS